MWFVDLIKEAELSFLFWGSKGLGSILLAVVLIAMAYILRPLRAADVLIALIELRSQHGDSKEEPPPRSEANER